MQSSKSRHNVFSKVDHDKHFIDKNYKGSKKSDGGTTSELPELNIDIRKRLAARQLSFRRDIKTPVITAAATMGADENAAKFKEQFADKGVAYDDDNASVVTNNSLALDMIKKDVEVHKIEDFMDELGKVGQVSDDEEEESSDSDDEYGEFVEKDRSAYTSPLDVHRHIMQKATKKNTLKEIKSVTSMKAIAKLKGKMKRAQSQDLLPSTTSEMTKALSDQPEPKASNSFADIAIAASSSFLFLSKLSKGDSAGSKTSSPTKSKQVTPSKASNRPANYSASPGGFSYSSKNSPGFDIDTFSDDGGSDTGDLKTPDGSPSKNGKLPLFARKNKAQNVSHSASSFSVNTLSTINAKFDTAGSALSAGKGTHAAKMASNAESLQAGPEGAESVYHVPTLSKAHENGKAKNILGHLDQLFYSFTFVKKDPIPPPDEPKPKPPLNLQTLLGDQLIKFDVPDSQQISDEELNELMNSMTTSHVNLNGHQPMTQKQKDSAAIVAQRLNSMLKKKQAEEVAAKVAKSMVSRLSSRTSPQPQQPASRLLAPIGENGLLEGTNDAKHQPPHPLPTKGTHTPNSNSSSPPKLDFHHLVSATAAGKPVQSANTKSVHKDAYEIDVHAVKLPDIYSPKSDTSSRAGSTSYAAEPILCIYSPAPLPNSSPGMSSPIQFADPLLGAPSGGSTKRLASNSPSASPGAIMFIGNQSLNDSQLNYAGSNYNSSTTGSRQHSPQRQPPSRGQVFFGGGDYVDDALIAGGRDEDHRYKTALHPETQTYLENVLKHSDHPNYHMDPRNYVQSQHHAGSAAVAGGGGLTNRVSPTAAQLEESLYNFDFELEEAAVEPPGDSGRVGVDAQSKTTVRAQQALLPSIAREEGGEHLLQMGYVYQHSTSSYVHSELANRSKFGQYQRSETPGDPLVGDFSDRALAGMQSAVVGEGAPVIYIPAGNPAAEPIGGGSDGGGGGGVRNNEKNAASVGGFASLTTSPAPPQKRSLSSLLASPIATGGNPPPVSALGPGDVLADSNYGGVRNLMINPGTKVTNVIHYNDGQASRPNATRGEDEDEDEDDDSFDSFRNGNASRKENTTSSSDDDHVDEEGKKKKSNEAAEPKPDIKQEINDYITYLSSGGGVGRGSPFPSPATGAGAAGGNRQAQSFHSAATGASASTAVSSEHAAEEARVKLWEKLNNRYAADPEGEFNNKKAIKEYIYDGVKADTGIMNEYMEEFEDGVW
mmetsp:Transcript_29965/g.50128  ORF Transcript_29965/g.50128 Transcript_29965/m.50128 type:complete len:1220 (-) Transcript_29965:174-3833(-)